MANRDDLIDAMIDVVFSEIEVPSPAVDWRTAMRRRGISLRDALLRHRWATGLMESRAHPGPANLGHHDAVLGNLRASGFSLELAAHAYSALDSYIYGFALTKMNLPFDASTDMSEMADRMLEPFPADTYPHLVEFITDHAMKPGYDTAASSSTASTWSSTASSGRREPVDADRRPAATTQRSRKIPSAISQIDHAM